jgi:hypothetical protein
MVFTRVLSRLIKLNIKLKSYLGWKIKHNKKFIACNLATSILV